MSVDLEKLIEKAAEYKFAFWVKQDKVFLVDLEGKGRKLPHDIAIGLNRYRDELREFVKGMAHSVRCVGCRRMDTCDGDCVGYQGGDFDAK